MDDEPLYSAPDHAFINTVLGMAQSFPWERFERFFEARPLVKASASDQVFLLRILAIQELLCVDDEGVLSWLKSQMYLSAFLSPGFKPKIPRKTLLAEFRSKLHDANLLEPFRLRCQNVILKKTAADAETQKHSDYMAEFAPSVADLPKINIDDVDKASEGEELQDKWVICPKCDSSSLKQIQARLGSPIPQASCKQCGYYFKV